MASNGYLPASDLRPIAGSGQLIAPAAAAWNAMAAYIYSETGQRIAPKGPYSSYRTYSQQVYMKQIYGSNAATPGTSNHGWGLAVDTAYDAVINQHGARFGWQKAWSDASWEPWHFKYASGHYSGPDPGPDYSSKAPKPSWWKKAKGKLKDLRDERRDKKRRRKHSPHRKALLHRLIERISGRIKTIVERMKKAR